MCKPQIIARSGCCVCWVANNIVCTPSQKNAIIPKIKKEDHAEINISKERIQGEFGSRMQWLLLSLNLHLIGRFILIIIKQ